MSQPRPPSGWECPRCHRVNAPTAGFCSCTPADAPGLARRVVHPGPARIGLTFDPDACPCSPLRGGSGICGCTLGSTVTC